MKTFSTFTFGRLTINRMQLLNSFEKYLLQMCPTQMTVQLLYQFVVCVGKLRYQVFQIQLINTDLLFFRIYFLLSLINSFGKEVVELWGWSQR